MSQARKFTLILGGFSCLVFSVRVWGTIVQEQDG